MKKVMFIAVAVALCFSCEKPVTDVQSNEKTKKFTFAVKGDFGAPSFTRGYLQADGQDMTDLWVFDYVGGVCVQSLHQTSEDEAWGRPTLALTYGSHHVYFVASRGEGATLNEEGHTITWTGPRDTFWEDYAVDVVSTSNGNRSVTLDRVATKLKIVITDEVPSECKKIIVTPEEWYYGWNYVDGVVMAQQHTKRIVDIPTSYVGTSGELAVSVFGLSGKTEWTTDVNIEAQGDNNSVVGSATITDAPFMSNRSTEYSGPIFGSTGTVDVGLSTEWQEAYQASW
jgi:hypothetical protein